MKYQALLLFVALLCGLAVQPASAQPKPLPKHEFRGAWVATVVNLDWPSTPTSSTSAQKAQLISILDKLKESGINAVLFQVRSEADAMYASDIEPWSYWLTGEQGKAPDPFYDPLAFAIEEAHKRGMELHAWFNPYRAVRGSGYTNAATHVSVQHPEWIIEFGNLKVLDPGLPEVRDYDARIIADVARRYDIDGVHFDDYFYPYPPNQVTNEDDATFAAHNRGFTNRGDWRRDNVNLFVAQVYDSLQVVRPSASFGISPFGIWKNGVPSGIVGLDAYNVIFADAVAWLDAQTIDYITPQLYWAFGGGQDYGRLAPWWASVRNDRHLYPGHGLYRSDPNTFSNTLFSANEIPRQVRFNRANPDIQGSVFFRAENITRFSSKGFADSLKTDLYRFPALTPPMAWKDQTPPGRPANLVFTWTGTDEGTLTWLPPNETRAEAPTQRYAVYRVRSATEPDFDEVMQDGRNLLAVTGETSLTDRPGIADDPYYYVVTAVSANSIEGARSNDVMADGRAVSTEKEQPVAFALHQNYPNPFNPSTEISFTLDAPMQVGLRVYNLLGQEVATLVEDSWQTIGTHTVRWESRHNDGRRAASGMYLYTLDVGTQRVTKQMVLIK